MSSQGKRNVTVPLTLNDCRQSLVHPTSPLTRELELLYYNPRGVRDVNPNEAPARKPEMREPTDNRSNRNKMVPRSQLRSSYELWDQ